MCKKGNSLIRLSNNPFNSFHRRILQKNINLPTSKNQSDTFQKLLTNNHKINLHRHHPKKIPKTDKTPKHPQEFLFKITHTLLRNDTLTYPNH